MPATKTLALTALSLALLTAIIAAGSCTQQKKLAVPTDHEAKPTNVIEPPDKEPTKPKEDKKEKENPPPPPPAPQTVIVYPPPVFVEPSPITIEPAPVVITPAPAPGPAPTVIVEPAPVVVAPAPAPCPPPTVIVQPVPVPTPAPTTPTVTHSTTYLVWVNPEGEKPVKTKAEIPYPSKEDPFWIAFEGDSFFAKLCRFLYQLGATIYEVWTFFITTLLSVVAILLATAGVIATLCVEHWRSQKNAVDEAYSRFFAAMFAYRESVRQKLIYASGGREAYRKCDQAFTEAIRAYVLVCTGDDSVERLRLANEAITAISFSKLTERSKIRQPQGKDHGKGVESKDYKSIAFDRIFRASDCALQKLARSYSPKSASYLVLSLPRCECDAASDSRVCDPKYCEELLYEFTGSKKDLGDSQDDNDDWKLGV